MKYFIRSEGDNRISLQLSLTGMKQVNKLGLRQVGWLRFQLFRWHLIDAEPRTGKIVCSSCGHKAIVTEQFLNGQSKGLSKNCIDCRDAARSADEYEAWY